MWKDLVLIGIVLICLDSMFFYSTGSIFKKQIELIQQTPFNINYFGVLFAYTLLIFGLYWFIIKENRGALDAFIFGIGIYGIYEGTTKALFEKWEYKTMAIDTLWGGIVMVLTTLIVYKLKNIK